MPDLTHADPHVAIRAVADPAYATGRAKKPGGEETYVFYPGHFFAGVLSDRTLERMPFESIARMLARDLQKQGYVPASRIDSSNLVIVVHWGVTTAFDRPGSSPSYDARGLSELSAASASRDALLVDGADVLSSEVVTLSVQVDDLSAMVNRQSEDLSLTGLTRDLRATSAAALLGITSALRRENDEPLPSARAAMLRAMLQEERYFIIAMAYDWQALRRDKALRRLWSVRLSVRAAGINFSTAIHRLSSAGGNVFGLQLDDLDVRRVKEPKGEVHFGELIVIGENDEPRPARKPAGESPAP